MKIIGHRGCRGTQNPPENSLAAFKKAIKQGADGVELDVFLSKDSEVMVFHDESLNQLTGKDGKIKDFTKEELKKLSLENSEENIPSLVEVLDLIEKYSNKDFLVNIEIKGSNIVENVGKIASARIKSGWKLEQFLISSFETENILTINKNFPELPIGGLLASSKEPWDVNEAQLNKYLGEIKSLKPKTINITLPSMTKPALEMINDIGAKAIAWTCNEKNPAQLLEEEKRLLKEKLTQPGLYGIITDYPLQIRELL